MNNFQTYFYIRTYIKNKYFQNHIQVTKKEKRKKQKRKHKRKNSKKENNNKQKKLQNNNKQKLKRQTENGSVYCDDECVRHEHPAR